MGRVRGLGRGGVSAMSDPTVYDAEDIRSGGDEWADEERDRNE
ncbi:hypothetical protein PP568_06900 [Mycobacteroides abscessus]|nr:hypothetical protein [Mycobacteroides abscessus]MDM2404659.1 hypothetical protein [Mycobacteroides abscessus]MDM2414377.1 hypothetical protein [Mycobacteroides abscessus]